MRVRSRWFKSDREKTPEEIASAVAFIAWRVAQNALKNTRKAQFAVDVGPQYFDFMQEFLVFLVQVADRIAHRRQAWNLRVAFITALAHRVGDILAENRSDLLGEPARDIKSRFIERLNQAAEDYAAFEYEPGGLNFAFVRCLGHAMESVMHGPDQQWVADQMMSIEAPEAMDTLERAFANLFDGQPPPPPQTGSVTCPE